LETIRSLEISDGNYEIALDLLQNRFDNRRLVFLAHITEILGLKAVQSSFVSTLRELSDKFNAHIRALKGLGMMVLFQKLDPASQTKGEERLRTLLSSIPTWESMGSFREHRFRTLETMDFAMANYAPGNQVDLLIGASLFFEMLCVGQIKLPPGLPLIQKTRLSQWRGASREDSFNRLEIFFNDFGKWKSVPSQLYALLRKNWTVKHIS